MPESTGPDPLAVAREAVRLHYGAREKKAAEKRYQQAIRSDEKEADSERRKYVKGRKVHQMRDWLWSLESQQCYEEMGNWEQGFFFDLLKKFKKYWPRLKWVTQKQYDALHTIAAKYLLLPREGVRK